MIHEPVPLSGGTDVTVQGLNFGPPGHARIMLGPNECLETQWISHAELVRPAQSQDFFLKFVSQVCVTPPATTEGQNLTVQVLVGFPPRSTLDHSPRFAFSYSDPLITSVISETPKPSTEGGSLVTIRGAQMGTTTSLPTIRIGKSICQRGSRL